MKYIILGLIFLGAPYLILNKLVMPELNQMKSFYGNIDQIAQNAATGQNNPSPK